MSLLTKQQIEQFQATVNDYCIEYGRHDLPWRVDTSPYAIFISELMLQQTQVSRVIPKFNQWLAQFPDFRTLATAEQSEVLSAWQGLGYNRRGRYAHQSAKLIVDELNGELSQTQSELEQLPGVGPNTAGAIRAYAFNQPAVYIETNIRTVYIHHFFDAKQQVGDKQLMPLVAVTLNQDSPRQWYWALMDYGVYLKRTIGNQAQRSKHYMKQSKFEGSLRQLRATALKTVLEAGALTYEQVEAQHPDPRLPKALAGLMKDELLQLSDGRYHA